VAQARVLPEPASSVTEHTTARLSRSTRANIKMKNRVSATPRITTDSTGAWIVCLSSSRKCL
jgi:hypothetical protein